MLRMGEVRNGGWKVHRCFDPNPFRTSARSLYGLEAIPTEFVRQTGERITVWYECVSYILVRGLVESLGLPS